MLTGEAHAPRRCPPRRPRRAAARCSTTPPVRRTTRPPRPPPRVGRCARRACAAPRAPRGAAASRSRSSPGATAFAVMPSRARSTARARISPTIPAFAAAYTGSERMAITGPVTEATMTIRPQRAARMCGIAARVTRNAVSRLRANPSCQDASGIAARSPASAVGSTIPTLAIPALLTTMCSPSGAGSGLHRGGSLLGVGEVGDEGVRGQALGLELGGAVVDAIRGRGQPHRRAHRGQHPGCRHPDPGRAARARDQCRATGQGERAHGRHGSARWLCRRGPVARVRRGGGHGQLASPGVRSRAPPARHSDERYSSDIVG